MEEARPESRSRPRFLAQRLPLNPPPSLMLLPGALGVTKLFVERGKRNRHHPSPHSRFPSLPKRLQVLRGLNDDLPPRKAGASAPSTGLRRRLAPWAMRSIDFTG